MKRHFSRIGVVSTLLFSLFVAGCGGGGGGGSGNKSVSGSGSGGVSASANVSENPAPVETPAPANPSPAPVETSAPVNAPDDSTVAASPETSSTLTWLPPTENVDSSAFSDAVGYKIYIGSQPGRYEIVRELRDPGLTEYVIEDVPPGKYYVAMTIVNSENIESPLSNVVVRVVGGG